MCGTNAVRHHGWRLPKGAEVLTVSGRTKLPSGLVTFMFTDIEGSTRLARMLGDTYGTVLGAHRSVVRTALRDFGGVELFTEGDSFFVAFGDAAAAVGACVAAQRALAAYDWPSSDVAPRVRMGLHTGWAVPVDGEYASAEVHRAARVASAAHGGQILCSEATALATTAWLPEFVPASGVPTSVVPASVVPGSVVPGSVVPGSVVRASVVPTSVVAVSGVLAAGDVEPDRSAANVPRPAPLTLDIAGKSGLRSGAGVIPLPARSYRPAAATVCEGGLPSRSLQAVTVTARRGTSQSRNPQITLSPIRQVTRVDEELWTGPSPRTEWTVGGPAAPAPARSRPVGRIDLTGVDLLDLGSFRLRGFDDAERLYQLVAPGLDRDFPRPRTPGAAAHNLPAALTSFVGRRAEVAELVALIGRHRLVTVAGAGGSGKTRLALAVAEELLVAYPEGVWVVDCATAGSGLPAAVAAALSLRAEPGRPILETLIESCADRRMLLVLETCEAAPGAAAALARRMLARCSDLDVLATGRQPLGVHGELVWRIPPLAPSDAFVLLSDRMSAARGGRAAGTEEAGGLARVASRLEGLPLAIELAAERLRLLSASQLASRLDDPLAALDVGRADFAADPGVDLLAALGAGRADFGADPGERHDSLAGTVAWSYRTLSEPAAALLRRLAVFAGPVDLAAVEWCGDDALGSLSELADKSLVDVVPGPRYRISGPVRAYATRRLAAVGEEQVARDRHVEWSLHALDRAAVDTDGQPRTVSLTALAPYVREWQTALKWSASGGSVPAGLRLARGLDPWWREHGGARDGRDLLYRLYARLPGTNIAPAELASAYLVHAGLADDPDERTRFLDRAEALARRADHPALLVRALAGRRVSLVESRPADAERVCRDVIARAERTAVPGAALPAVAALAELLWRRDALDEAAELLGGARQIEAGRPEDRGRRTVDWLLGMVALRRRDLVAAHDHLVVALRSRLRHGFRGAAADAVAAIAVRCAIGGDPATATVLFGGAESVRGERRTPVFGGFWAAQQAVLRSTLGDAAFDAAYADGARAGFDRIVAMALAVEHPDLEHGSARFAPTLR
jgi:predicted ATPase/class 3 adenylate cyclase